MEEKLDKTFLFKFREEMQNYMQENVEFEIIARKTPWDKVGEFPFFIKLLNKGEFNLKNIRIALAVKDTDFMIRYVNPFEGMKSVPNYINGFVTPHGMNLPAFGEVIWGGFRFYAPKEILDGKEEEYMKVKLYSFVFDWNSFFFTDVLQDFKITQDFEEPHFLL